MRKLFFLMLMSFLAAHARGQQCRVLENADGNRKKVVYFQATRDYYPCGGPAMPRKKLVQGETLLNLTCNCYMASSGIIHPISPGASIFSNIQFNFNSAVLDTASFRMLDEVAADLRSSGGTVELRGYASSEGVAGHNIALAKDRATSVKTYLVNAGVAADKIRIRAYGESSPVADNSTEDGRALNRRVEFSSW